MTDGTVTARSGAQSAEARVILNVVAKAKSPLTFSPSSFTFRTQAGVRGAPQTLTVTSAGWTCPVPRRRIFDLECAVAS